MLYAFITAHGSVTNASYSVYNTLDKREETDKEAAVCGLGESLGRGVASQDTPSALLQW